MRCFLAIELPEAVRNRLARLQDTFRDLGRSVRWTPPEHIHLTIKFLGQVSEEDLPGVYDAASSVAADHEPFELAIRRTGCFPPTGPVRILWVGVPSVPEMLLGCQRACEEHYARLGYRKETRPYRAHLTIGRVREASATERVREALSMTSSFSAEIFVAKELVLFQSILGPSGPKYAVLTRAQLGGPASS